MARVTDVFVKGTVENVVFYRRMGTSCSRMKRHSIQQTAPTKIRGINFGIAARAGKGLRSNLINIMPNPTDRSMQSRFSGAIAKWLGLANIDTLPPCDVAEYISNFQFSSGATFNTRFRVPITVTQHQNDTITLSIDAFVPVEKIQAPANTASVKLTITVAGCMLKTGMPTGHATHVITIPYNNIEIPAQIVQLYIPVPAGSLTLTAASLRYYTGNANNGIPLFNTEWMQAAVVNALYN